MLSKILGAFSKSKAKERLVPESELQSDPFAQKLFNFLESNPKTESSFVPFFNHVGTIVKEAGLGGGELKM